MAPAMLLLPPPFVPARTVMQGGPGLASATVPGASLLPCRGRRLAECGRRGTEESIDRPPRGLRLHAGKEIVELTAQRAEVRCRFGRQTPILVEGQQHRCRGLMLGDDDPPSGEGAVEQTPELVLRVGGGDGVPEIIEPRAFRNLGCAERLLPIASTSPRHNSHNS